MREEIRLIDPAGDVVIQHRLEGLLKELQTDRQHRMTGMLALDHGQLIEMVLVTVMGLAHEDHSAVRDLFGQPIHADQTGKIDHCRLWCILIRHR